MNMADIASPSTDADATSHGLQAADFLLDPETFVRRCVAAHPAAEAALTSAQCVALADAIRAGRPRIEVVEAIRRYTSPTAGAPPRMTVNGLARDWSGDIVVEQLARYAPGDDAAFVQQVYGQTLERPPTSIEAIEAKFDLKGGLSRTDFIQRVARRSPSCQLSSDGAVAGLGSGLTAEGKFAFSFIEPTAQGGWAVANDVYLQAGPTIEGALQVSAGVVLSGPKRSFAPGDWHLAIDLVQPEEARITVDAVANAGLDVLASFDLVGPARLVTAFRIEPWHHFLMVRLHKAAAAQTQMQLRIRTLMLRQP